MSPKKVAKKNVGKKAVPQKTASKATAKTVKGKKPSHCTVNASIAKPVREYWEQLAWSDISEHFGDRTTERGRRYGEGRNVRSLWATEDGKTLLAVVSGEYDYTTIVRLENGRRKNQFILFSDCSCPVGVDCKHGVAAITLFLDRLANDTPIPLCVEINDETWETYSPDGKKQTLKIDFDEHDDEDDWDDDDDGDDDADWKPVSSTRRGIRQTVAVNATKKNDKIEAALREKLQTQSKDDLVALILRLHGEYDDVREHFAQEAFAESVAKTSDVDKLVQKANRLIDKGLDVDPGNYYRYGRYDDYDDGPPVDLDAVEEIVRQFKKFDDPLTAFDEIARHLIKKGKEYVEQFQVEDTDEIESVFEEMADVLIASKTPPIRVILWADEICDVDEYSFAAYAEKKIREHKWPTKTWSGVADGLLERFRETSADQRYWGDFQVVIDALDKAGRQKEATDFLRREANKDLEFDMLVERLIKHKHLAEAKKIATERYAEEMKTEKDQRYYRDSEWPDKLKIIAEKQKDWAALASIQAAELFERPCRNNVAAVVKTAKKLKAEPVVRKAIEKFLKTGEFPAATAKSLQGRKPTAADRKNWPIPHFEFRPDKDARGENDTPLYNVLCQWAIDENRSKDVLHWFDELSKLKQTSAQQTHRRVDLQEVADAIVDIAPDRALQIYLERAEHEMESTRDYPAAVRQLAKAKKTLEKCGRNAEWPAIIEDIRTRHRRKSSLMKQLNEFEAGSIVKQKRQTRR